MKRILEMLTALVMLMTCCYGAAAFAEAPAKEAMSLEYIQALNGGNAVIQWCRR